MRNVKSIVKAIAAIFVSGSINAQCTGIDFIALPDTIIQCGGDSVHIDAVGQGAITNAIDNNFNTGGAGTDWGASPAATFTNPCGPGPGGSTDPYLWMGTATAAPRNLETNPLDLSCGATINFDFKMSEQINGSSPCEGPDGPTEGIYLEWSAGPGMPWNLINYFEPNTSGSLSAACTGCGDYTAWGSYSFALPTQSGTTTIIRWWQGGSSGPDFDHWGLDNIVISTTSCSDYWYNWSHISGLEDSSYIDEFVEFNTTYDVLYTNGIDDTCSASVTILVDTIFNVSSVITEEFCNEDDNGTIAITALGGYPGYSYALSGPSGPQVNATGTFDNLIDGTYIGIVSGSSGCKGYDTIELAQGFQLRGTLSTTDAPCFGDDGNIAYVPDTGVNPFTYVIEQGSVTVYNNTVPLFLNESFQSGSYQMTVSDSNGCMFDTLVIVNSPPQIIPSFTPSTFEGVFPLPVSFTNTTIGGSGYSWDFGDGIGTSTDFSPSYTFADEGIYTVILTVQDGPCSWSTSQTIVVIDESSVEAPNVITPNGDNRNDLFIVNYNSIKEHKIIIMNRWGIKIFESTDPNEYWDGTNKAGKTVSLGTYFYIIEAVGIDEVVHKKSGHITVFKD